MNVTYEDKNKAINDGIRNEWRDTDANEVKDAVNSKADSTALAGLLVSILGGADTDNDTLQKLAVRINNLNSNVTDILALLASDNLSLDTLQEIVDKIEEFEANPAQFESDILVNLAPGKTLGQYTNGMTIPAAGKSPEQVLNLIAVEQIAPLATLDSPTTIQFNQTAVSNTLNFTKTLQTPGASFVSAVLEWRRNNSGSWVELTSNLADTTYVHNLTDSAFNSQVFNYRYTVVDSNSKSTQVTFDITPVAYVAPTVSGVSLGSLTRELGNNDTTATGTINRNSPMVSLTSYKLQYQVNGAGAWADVDVAESISGASAPINKDHDPAIGLVDSSSLSYRVLIIDAYQTFLASSVTIVLGTVNFVHKSVLGYDVDPTVSLAEILAFGNSSLTNGKARTINAVTAPDDQYTYYCYASVAGALVGITDGLESFLGAFTALANVSGVNSFGASVNYKVYKSNATKAFTNVNLTFS